MKPTVRPECLRKAPANKLSEVEREQIIETCNSQAFNALPPSQIVPILADQGESLASESSFYRVLRSEGPLEHRGKARAPRKVAKPAAYPACGPNQVWSWDITSLASTVLGLFPPVSG
ncbi:MAG: hypothetical protein ACFCVA_11450 [Gammaproteobacteria bacterium]